jgi:protein SCO1/2
MAKFSAGRAFMNVNRWPVPMFLHRLSALLGSLILAGSLVGDALAADAPRVVVSIKPLHALLSGLMQGVGEPQLLVDSEHAPWQYQPGAAQSQAIANADLVIWSGPELEVGLAPVLQDPPPGQQVFEVLESDALKVLPARDAEDGRDPFYWLDSRNMLILLDIFGQWLSEVDPQRSPAYERNWQLMAEALSEIDREMEFRYRDVSGEPVYFYHDTHQYFEQAYAMHVAGSVVAVSGGEKTDAAQLLAIRSRLSAGGPACLFTEKGLAEPHLDLLLDTGNVTEVELDSFGVDLPAGPDLYVNLMRRNFAAISQCVRSLRSEDKVAALPASPDLSRSPDRLVPRYAMLDQHGRTVSQEDFPDQLQLIYFGYTFCPDICPTSLAVMSRALQLLGEEAEQIQPIFITVDPERDTPELLGEYVKYFHPRMLGLSASPEITQRVAELFRARYERVASESGDVTRYSMDHTASLYLLGRRAEFITKFAHGLPANEVAQRLREHLHD